MKRKTLAYKQSEGISALIREPGLVDTARFIRLFYLGTGDYPTDRRNLENRRMDELVVDMKEKRIRGLMGEIVPINPGNHFCEYILMR